MTLLLACNRRKVCDNSSMIIPQFTIRSLLLWTVVAAVLAWIVSQGLAGAMWAQSLAWTAAFAGLLLCFHALLFAMIRRFSYLQGKHGPRVVTPFATPQASDHPSTAE